MKRGFSFYAVGMALLILSCTTGKMLSHGVSTVYDFEYFANRRIKASQTPYQFKKPASQPNVPLKVSFGNRKDVPLDTLMEENDTLAFLILKDDVLVYERYFNGHTPGSVSYSFSMAKSFTSMLVGMAIDDGLIESELQPVTDFVPELERNGFHAVTLRHLLQMTSGMDYLEVDNPFGIHPHFYWAMDTVPRLMRLHMEKEPGRTWSYKSGEAQLLGYVLSRALGDKTLSRYMQEKVWQPLGMETDALWSLDHEGGLEKTFCCIAGSARDFMKIGRLYLNRGEWEGKRILSESWVDRSTKLDTAQGSIWKYQYQWWKFSESGEDFVAVGHLGQYLYVHPEKHLVILRLGTSRGDIDVKQWKEILLNIKDQF